MKNLGTVVLEVFDFTGPKNSSILQVFSKTDTVYTPALFPFSRLGSVL